MLRARRRSFRQNSVVRPGLAPLAGDPQGEDAGDRMVANNNRVIAPAMAQGAKAHADGHSTTTENGWRRKGAGAMRSARRRQVGADVMSTNSSPIKVATADPAAGPGLIYLDTHMPCGVYQRVERTPGAASTPWINRHEK